MKEIKGTKSRCILEDEKKIDDKVKTKMNEAQKAYYIKEKITDENVVLTITPTDGTIDKIATSKLYVAEYDGEGQLIGIKLGENQNVDGKLIITAESPKTDNFKLMLWDKTNNPIINAISDIH